MTGLEPSASELAGLRRADGSPLNPGGLLGSGGEGWVYRVAGSRPVALKFYQPAVLSKRGAELAAKLQLMVDNPPGNPTASMGHSSLAWPEEIIVDQRGMFAGFTMPMLDRQHSLAMHQVVNPSELRNPGLPGWIAAYEDWGRLIHTAGNLAAATQSLHDSGYVIGDFNESNLVVTDRALVTMIDCDSMQVPRGNGSYFLCTVGKPEYTAPEVHDFNTQPRTSRTDDFALAVHCFMLLMRGRHPFSGIWHGPGDKPSQLSLARRGLYSIAGDPALEPQRGTPPAAVLPPSVRDLFTRAFARPGNPAGRPSAEEWATALFEFNNSLVTCSLNSRHRYGSHLRQCPWCQMDAARPVTRTGGQRPYQPIGPFRQQLTTPGPLAPAHSFQPAAPYQGTNVYRATQPAYTQRGTGQRPVPTAVTQSPATHRTVAVPQPRRFSAKAIAWTAGMAAALIAAIGIVVSSAGSSSGGNAPQEQAPGATAAASPAVSQPPEHSSAAALPTHYAAKLTSFVPAATRTKSWRDSSSTDSSTIGAAHFVNNKLTLSFTAHHSGEDSALSEGTGGACVTVDDGGVNFNEMPMTATPSIDATYPDNFSGSITVAAFMPGTYTLTWGCNTALYTSESITLGTLEGNSIRSPQVDDLYGDWIWFIMGLDYTSSTTTVHLATISGNGVIQESGKIWHLAGDNNNVVASAQSKIMSVDGKANQIFNGSSKVVYLKITFAAVGRGLELYCDDELNPGVGEKPLP